MDSFTVKCELCGKEFEPVPDELVDADMILFPDNVDSDHFESLLAETPKSTAELRVMADEELMRMGFDQTEIDAIRAQGDMGHAFICIPCQEEALRDSNGHN